MKLLIRQSLQIFVDDSGILRCDGSLKNGPISKETKYPILLARNSHFRYLVIKDCHGRVIHNGIGNTLTELGAAFWVTQGRQSVRKVVIKCSVCKKIQRLSYRNYLLYPSIAYSISLRWASILLALCM